MYPRRDVAMRASDATRRSRSVADLAPLLGLVAGGDRVLDAMRRMIGEDLLLGAPQRGAHRRELRHDIDAIAVVLDHAREAAHLALDPFQPFEHRSLGKGCMLAIYPYRVSVSRGKIVTSTRASFADGRGCRHRSGLRHDSRSGENPHHSAIGDQAYYFCAAGCAPNLPKIRRNICKPRRRANAAAPQARSIPARCIRRSPASRDRALARSAEWRSSRQRTARCRHNPELADMTRRFWIGARVHAAGLHHGNGRPFRRAGSISRRRSIGHNRIQLASVDAGRAVGRLAVLRARLALVRPPQSQHVQLDRDGHGRRLRLQRRCNACAATVPAGLSRT